MHVLPLLVLLACDDPSTVDDASTTRDGGASRDGAVGPDSGTDSPDAAETDRDAAPLPRPDAGSPTTPLGMLAASMEPGTWTQMTPTPSGLDLFVGGPHSGVRTGYSTRLAYDPAGKRMYFLGCDHNQEQRFVQYDEAANEWTELPAAPWSAPTKHGYEHTVWDTTHGVLYHRPFYNRAVYQWNGGSDWTERSYTSVLDYTAGANALEWFPDLGPNGHLLLFQTENGTNGELVGFDPVLDTWTSYAEGETLAGAGDPHNSAHYSHVHRLVWFGGGNGSIHMWTIDASGTVAPAADIPEELGMIGPGNDASLAVTNPFDGTFIVMRNASTWYDYEPIAQRWTRRPGTADVLAPPVNDDPEPTFGTVAVPIDAYDVIVFVKAVSREAPAQMWLYHP